MSKYVLAWLAIIITTVVWASSLIFAKMLYEASIMTPILFVALRYTLAVPFLAVLALTQRNRTRISSISRTSWGLLIVAGLTGPFLSQVMQYIGLGMTTAGETLLLLNLSPVFVVILAAPLLNERITSAKLGGLLLGILGVSLIVMGGSELDATLSFFRIAGDLIIVVSTMIFALNGIAGKMVVGTVDSISVTFYSTLAAVPCIWISAAIFEDLTILFHMNTEAWLIIFWVAIVNTVIGFILYYESMKHIEASRVQITLNLMAVWGVLMSFFILNEQQSIIQFMGGGLTVLGVIITNYRSNKIQR